jgi:pilus assembly protein CpaE
MRNLVSEGLSDRKLAKSTIQLELGGLDAAIRRYEASQTPSIIIVETNDEGDALMMRLEALAEVCDPGTNVILLGGSNDIELYRDLVRRGISEYLVKPVAPRRLFEAVAEICMDPDAAPMGRLLAFIGSRGGSGSSTLSHNIGWDLGQAYHEEVVIIDLDISFGTAGLAFNLETPQGIHSALSEPNRLDEVLLERFLAEYDEYVRLLVSPAALDAEEKLYMDALDRLLELVRQRAAYVILDLPHRWAPWTQQLLLDADEVVIVSLPDLAGLRDSRHLIARLKEFRGDQAPVHLVLNHAGAYRRSELSAKDFENAVELAPALVIPHDPNLFGSAANNGQMLGEVNRRHKVSEMIRQLALRLGGREPVEQKKASFLNMLRKNKTKTKAKG